MVYCQIKWAFCTFQAFRSFFLKIAFANSTGSVSQLSVAINLVAEGLRLKNTKPLLVLWSFNKSAVYPYTGGLKLVPMLNVSSTYFLKLSAVACHLTRSSHGSRSKEPGMYLKRTKKLSLGLCHTQIRPDEHDIVAILSGQ